LLPGDLEAEVEAFANRDNDQQYGTQPSSTGA
jgi:hypothetical protein